MFQDCDCTTIHTLASEITSFLPNKNVDKVRNMTEFTFTRSSPAFRHSVLVDNQLSSKDTHCFDIIEEAFTAMIKESMPVRRNNGKSFQQILVAEIGQSQSGKGEDRGELGMDRTRLSMSSPRSMSTLKMFDINDEYWENEYQEYLYQSSIDLSAQEVQEKHLDWVSYVDEMYENEDSA
jgi:hypothetical protein